MVLLGLLDVQDLSRNMREITFVKLHTFGDRVHSNVFDSSTVTTPSLPTLSASAILPLTVSSAAEIDATLAIWSFESATCWLWTDRFNCCVSSCLYSLRTIGFSSCSYISSLLLPWLEREQSAVVVPSPATSLVLLLLCLTSCTPYFQMGLRIQLLWRLRHRHWLLLEHRTFVKNDIDLWGQELLLPHQRWLTPASSLRHLHLHQI